MPSGSSFGDVFQKLVAQDGRTPGQLSRRTASLFGDRYQVPRETIVRWLKGTVERPRHWQDIARVAAALRLSVSEADQLLITGGHHSLTWLRQLATNPPEKDIFAVWDTLGVLPANIPVPFQAPPRRPTFVGREDELHQLADAILRPVSPGCCIIGMAGVGKTTLALEAAYRWRDHFPDGVLWVDVAGIDVMALMLNMAAAYWLDVSRYTDVANRSSKLRELLASKRALIVFDNVTHDSQVQPLLPPTGACAQLVLTQEHQLAVADSFVRLELQPFDPDKEESLALLSHILGSTRVSRERDLFQELADLLGHLPLAVDIAAHRLKHEVGWTPSSFVEDLRRIGVHGLTRGASGVEAVFHAVYTRLKPNIQRFLATLSLFGNRDFGLDAAAAAADLTLPMAHDALQILHNVSLVQINGDDRYYLHPLVRDFAVRKPHDPGAAGRMSNYFIGHAITHKTDNQALAREQPHILVALDAPISQGQPHQFVESVIAMAAYWIRTGALALAEQHLARVDAVTRPLGNKADLMAIMTQRGRLAVKRARFEQALAFYTEALELARQSATPETVGDLLRCLGAVAHRQGRLEDAAQLYAEARSLAESSRATNLLIKVIHNQGLVAAVQGRVGVAEVHYRQALDLALETDFPDLLVEIHQSLGRLIEKRGDYGQARSHYETGFRLAEQLRNPELQSRLLGCLGLVAWALGNYAEAAARYRRGLALAEEGGFEVQVGRHLANLGQVATRCSDYVKADYYFGEALTRTRACNLPEDIAIILNYWGESRLYRGQLEEATAAFREALLIARKGNYAQEIARALFGLARSAAARGNVDEARHLGEEAYATFATLKHLRTSELLWWLRELPGSG